MADGDFVTTILGGAWAACNRGVAFNSVKAYARTKEIKAWCRRYGLQDSASYSFVAYGDELASVLSLAWCHRVQWYYSEWAAVGDPRLSACRPAVVGQVRGVWGAA